MQTALITGASRGLGLALARALAKEGWALLIDARGTEALEAVRAELAQQTRVIALAGDVTNAAHRRALAAAAEALGGLDAVVNNAGILGPSPQPTLLDYPLDVLEDVYRANVIAPLAVLQAVRASLRSGARILNLSSDAAVGAYPGWGGYGSSKAALEQLSAVLAAENPAWKVYWVNPGDMRTQMHQDAFPGEDISDRPLPEASVPGLLRLLSGDLPSGRYQARSIDQTERPDWLNIVLTVKDFEAAASFFRDALGLPVEEEWHNVGHGLLLSAGRATLEIVDGAQADEIDRVEVGRSVNQGRVRLAIGVADVGEVSEVLQEAGARRVGAVVDTPWGHRNQRLESPEGTPITLFQVMNGHEGGAS